MQFKSLPINIYTIDIHRVVGDFYFALQTAERRNLLIHIGANVVQAHAHIGVIDNQIVHLRANAVKINGTVRVYVDSHSAGNRICNAVGQHVFEILNHDINVDCRLVGRFFEVANLCLNIDFAVVDGQIQAVDIDYGLFQIENATTNFHI